MLVSSGEQPALQVPRKEACKLGEGNRVSVRKKDTSCVVPVRATEGNRITLSETSARSDY